MAPKRRTQVARRTPSAQQSQLSFNSKVTKQASQQQAKSSKKDPALAEEVLKADVRPDAPSEEENAASQQVDEDAVADPLQTAHGTVKTEDVLGGRAKESDAGAVGGKGSGWVADEETRARKISDTQIKKYWRDKELERKAPRVHQEDLTVYEKVLREWDMSGQYGVRTTRGAFVYFVMYTDGRDSRA